MQYSGADADQQEQCHPAGAAWFYPVPDRTGNFGFNPLVVDDVMYVLGQKNASSRSMRRRASRIWSHVPEGGSRGQPRDQLLGEQGSIGPAVDLRRRRHASRDRRAHRAT